MKSLPLAALLAVCPIAAAAHPHVFIDTGVEVIFDAEGRAAQLQITWTYDELYSLWITEDMELDPDFDNKLTAAELAKLQGFDQDWMEGYYGDTRAYLGGVELGLSRPVSYTASYEGGRLTSTHIRDIEGAPELTDTLVIKPYDETYYTAYDVTLPVRLTGRSDCGFERVEPDTSGALSALAEQLMALDPDEDPAEAGFVEDVGAQFATEIRVTCPAR